jgi:hypothetical protein
LPKFFKSVDGRFDFPMRQFQPAQTPSVSTGRSRRAQVETADLRQPAAGRSKMAKKRDPKAPFLYFLDSVQAALSHIAVSKALLISGIFMPKLALLAAFEFFAAGLTATVVVPSVARSHDPFSWERATEKNRST